MRQTAQALFTWIDRCAAGEKIKKNNENEIRTKHKEPLLQTPPKTLNEEDRSQQPTEKQTTTHQMSTLTKETTQDRSDTSRCRSVTATMAEKDKAPLPFKSLASIEDKESKNITSEVISNQKSHLRSSDEFTKYVLIFGQFVDVYRFISPLLNNFFCRKLSLLFHAHFKEKCRDTETICRTS